MYNEYNYVHCPRCKTCLILEAEKICILCEKELDELNSSLIDYDDVYNSALNKIPKSKYMDSQCDTWIHNSIRSTCLYKHHRVELRRIIFPYKNETKLIKEITVVADYCYDCEQYQVSRLRLKQRGWNVKNLIYKKIYKPNSTDKFSEWKSSPLAMWGIRSRPKFNRCRKAGAYIFFDQKRLRNNP